MHSYGKMKPSTKGGKATATRSPLEHQPSSAATNPGGRSTERAEQSNEKQIPCAGAKPEVAQPPCAVCKLRKQTCAPDCVYAPILRAKESTEKDATSLGKRATSSTEIRSLTPNSMANFPISRSSSIPACAVTGSSDASKRLVQEQNDESDFEMAREPPRGAVVMSLEELLIATQKKKGGTAVCEKPSTRPRLTIQCSPKKNTMKDVVKRTLDFNSPIREDGGRSLPEKRPARNQIQKGPRGDGSRGQLARIERARTDWRGKESEEGSIENFYGQLWFVPNSAPTRVSPRARLLWVRRRLWEQGKATVNDFVRAKESDTLSDTIIHLRGDESVCKELQAFLMAAPGRGRGRRPPWRPEEEWGYGDEYWGYQQQPRYGPRRGRGYGDQGYDQYQQFQGRGHYQQQVPRNQQLGYGRGNMGQQSGGNQPTHPVSQAQQKVSSQQHKAKSIPTAAGGSSQIQKEAQVSKDTAGTSVGDSSKDGKAKVTCYNCGGTGHYVADCARPKLCFICHQGGHECGLCPEWKQSVRCATYLGSGSQGLGFFHVDVSEKENRFRHVLNLENCALLTVDDDGIQQEVVVEKLKSMYGSDWDWTLKEIEPSRYLVRFPPHKQVADMVSNDAVWLNLGGLAWMSVKMWDGEIQPMGTLKEAWVQVKGIPLKWLDWYTFREVGSTLGKVCDIDWNSILSNFGIMVRMKIKCMNPVLIPKEKVFEFEDKLYTISFTVETDKVQGGSDDKGDDDGGKSPEDEGDEEDKQDKSGKGKEQPTDEQTRNQRKGGTQSKESDNKQDKSENRGSVGGKAAKVQEEIGVGEGNRQKSDQTTKGERQTIGRQDSDNSNRKWADLIHFEGEDRKHEYSCRNLLREMELEESDEEEITLTVSSLMMQPDALPADQNKVSHNNERVKDIVLHGVSMESLNTTEQKGQEESQDKDTMLSETEKRIEEQIVGILQSPTKENQEEQLPNEEVFQQQKQGKKKTKTKQPQKWGPIQVETRTRKQNQDGIPMVEKAQALKRRRNLEDQPVDGHQANPMEGLSDDGEMETAWSQGHGVRIRKCSGPTEKTSQKRDLYFRMREADEGGERATSKKPCVAEENANLTKKQMMEDGEMAPGSKNLGDGVTLPPEEMVL